MIIIIDTLRSNSFDILIYQTMISKKYVASLDQSTTSTKFSLYLFDGTLVDQQIVFHKQISERQGWLEHDPIEISDCVKKSISTLVMRMKAKDEFHIEQILGMGLCNQRETVVCWDAESGQPVYNAIVWCDARTKEVCQRFKTKYNNFTSKTGLPVSTYFSLFKIIWLLENVEGLSQKAKEGKVRFGTIDTWVALLLTGKYVTDSSNASRTHLMDIKTGKWDQQLIEIAGINPSCLPQIVNSFEKVGEILLQDLKGVPLSCILGDQQSSAYAHSLSSTDMKITYGTGCFMLNNIGPEPIIGSEFVTTVLHQKDNKRTYGFEVSVECGGGTINWARKAGFFEQYSQLNNLEEPVENLHFIPTFGTIFCPYWKSNVQGGLVGLNFNTTKKHILSSILQSITFRLYDNIKSENFKQISKIIVDGGMTVNKNFMQLQADTFGIQIEVRTLDTCWGVAKGVLTSEKIKHHGGIKDISTLYKPSVEKHGECVSRYEKWSEARNKFYGWI